MAILQTNKCSGCMACLNKCPVGAITKVQKDGFEYPKINENKCVNCGLCEKVCPVNTIYKTENVKEVYACKNKNDDIRLKSSSGGVFTIMAEKIIENNGVVFGARFDENFNVVHDYTECIDGLATFRSSKYVQSDLKDTFKKVKEFLNEGRKVLYVGTPCQIEGLNAFLNKKYDNLVLVDLICHGVPSKKLWKQYIKYRNKENKKIKNINFRSKEDTIWYKYNVVFEYENQKDVITHSQDVFMKLFLKDYALRESCYECSFKKINRVSDITIADFWGLDKIDQDFFDDKGVTSLIIHSQSGKNFFNEIKKSMEYKEMNINDITNFNPMYNKSTNINPRRNEFMEDLENMKFVEIIKKYIDENS